MSPHCYLVLAPEQGELETDLEQPLGEGVGAAPGAVAGAMTQAAYARKARAARAEKPPVSSSLRGLLAGYDAAQRRIADGSHPVALGASGTALLHTVAVFLGERFFGE
jgi:hypothetical protein